MNIIIANQCFYNKLFYLGDEQVAKIFFYLLDQLQDSDHLLLKYKNYVDGVVNHHYFYILNFAGSLNITEWCLKRVWILVQQAVLSGQKFF